MPDVLPVAYTGNVSFAGKLQTNLVNNLVGASVETAIQGGDFGDNIVSRLRSAGVNQLLSVADGIVGDLTDGAKKIPVANLITHAIVGGLAAEATGGKFAAGAAAGLASAVAAQSGLFDGLSAKDIAKISQLVGASAALLAGGNGRDVNQGAETAQSAALNNYLTHAQVQDYKSKLDACGGNKGCEAKLFLVFRDISVQQSDALRACGTSNACLEPHLRALAEASVSSAELFRDARVHPWAVYTLETYQGADFNSAIRAYRYNQHLESVCQGLDSGCIRRYELGQLGTGAVKTAADFTPVVGDIKGFVDAYNSGSRIDWAIAIIGIAPVVGDGLGKLLKAGKLDNIARAEFDALQEVANLTKSQRDAAYVEFVLKAGSNRSPTQGIVHDANFAQSSIRKSGAFTDKGAEKYTQLAGRPITTVEDLSSALRDGALKISDVPVDYVIRADGTKLILNSRTSVALDRAGIPKSEWFGTNKTGLDVPDWPEPGKKTFDELAHDQIKNNKLPETGSPNIPIWNRD